MGTWSTAILGNDTSCEVHERFIELYNSGEGINKISTIVLEEQQENLKYDRTNVWFGLALACWECKVLTDKIFNEVKKIIDSKEDILICKDLDADDKYIKHRQIALDNFIVKISKDKEKSRARKKLPVQVKSIYAIGQCAVYKNESGDYIGIYMTGSDHYKNEGSIDFIFLDYENNQVPTLKQIEGSRLLWLKKNGSEWKDCEYLGKEKTIKYDKSNKQGFDCFVKDNFLLIGELGIFNLSKITFNSEWRRVDFKDGKDTLRILEEQRKDDLNDNNISKFTLKEFLNKIGQK